jgi:uncharacterized OB-fold protein
MVGRVPTRFDDGLASAPVFGVDGDVVRLRGSRCEACGMVAFPRRAVCLACGGAHAPATLSGEGVVAAATVVENPPQGFSDGFVYLAVELHEGPRVLGAAVAGARLGAGDRVRAVPGRVRDGEAGFRFEPAGDA